MLRRVGEVIEMRPVAAKMFHSKRLSKARQAESRPCKNSSDKET
jgi:hypothetical protein